MNKKFLLGLLLIGLGAVDVSLEAAKRPCDLTGQDDAAMQSAAKRNKADAARIVRAGRRSLQNDSRWGVWRAQQALPADLMPAAQVSQDEVMPQALVVASSRTSLADEPDIVESSDSETEQSGLVPAVQSSSSQALVCFDPRSAREKVLQDENGPFTLVVEFLSPKDRENLRECSQQMLQYCSKIPHTLFIKNFEKAWPRIQRESQWIIQLYFSHQAKLSDGTIVPECALTPDNFKALSSCCPNLKILNFSYHTRDLVKAFIMALSLGAFLQLRELYLITTHTLSWEVQKIILNCKELERLNLHFCDDGVAKGVIAALKSFSPDEKPALKWLNLTFTNATPAEMAEIRALLPGCHLP